jgi:hypothetical protein
MLANFLGVLSILTPPLCALTYEHGLVEPALTMQMKATLEGVINYKTERIWTPR